MAEPLTAVARIEAFRTQLEQRESQFAAALPRTIAPAKFARVAMTAVTMNPKLLQVERTSLLLSLMKCAQDGLIPDGKEAAMVIFRDKTRGEIATYIPMVAGVRKLVIQSGKVHTFDQRVVHENDDFDYELGSSPRVHHRPALKDRGEVIGAYSVAVLEGGYRSIEVMGIEEVEGIRKVSRSKDKGPWIDWYDEMVKKTIAKRHAKMLPLSSELVLQDEDDEAPALPQAAEPKMRLSAQFDRLVEHDVAPEQSDEAVIDEDAVVVDHGEESPR